MTDREKREGKTEIQKFEYLKSKNSFLFEIKIIFHNQAKTRLLFPEMQVTKKIFTLAAAIFLNRFN